MAEVIAIRTDVLATITTGVGLGKMTWMDVEDAYGHVLGYEVFTHELLDGPLRERARELIVAQHPGLPVERSADIDASVADLRTRFPERLDLHRGPDVRTARGGSSFGRILAQGLAR